MRKTYSYNGPVMDRSGVVDSNWKATTCAGTEKRAKKNLIDQYRKEHGIPVDQEVILPAKAVSY